MWTIISQVKFQITVSISTSTPANYVGELCIEESNFRYLEDFLLGEVTLLRKKAYKYNYYYEVLFLTQQAQEDLEMRLMSGQKETLGDIESH